MDLEVILMIVTMRLLHLRETRLLRCLSGVKVLIIDHDTHFSFSYRDISAYILHIFIGVIADVLDIHCFVLLYLVSIYLVDACLCVQLAVYRYSH